MVSRDELTFLSVEEPNRWACGPMLGGPIIRLLRINPYPAHNLGGGRGERAHRAPEVTRCLDSQMSTPIR